MRTVRAFAPGRTEIAGNHTDHQGGRVVAAAVSCGVEMRLEPRADGRAHVESEGFAPFEIALSDDAARTSGEPPGRSCAAWSRACVGAACPSRGSA